MMGSEMRLALEVNGEAYALEVPDSRRLVDVLRDDLHLLGTKLACGEGACGACAVLLDGRAVNSCLLLAAVVEGHAVTTIEGVSATSPSLLQAFVAEDALQCGYCTPGQVVSAAALLARVPRPTREQVQDALSGNLCRCGAYAKIELAVLRAARESG